MKRLCDVCGDRHEAHQAHVFKTASHAVSHKPKMANTYRYRDPEKRRWYMRIYMAVRRAVKAGRAEWWPRRA